MKKFSMLLLLQMTIVFNAQAMNGERFGFRVLKKQQITNDFFVRIVSQPKLWSARHKPQNVDCQTRIQNIICLAENSDSSCVRTAEIPVDKVIEIYNQLPRFFKKGMCELTQIRIEKNMNSTAYATVDVNENWEPVGGLVGINQAALITEQNFSNWISWKEQLNFGGSKEPGKLTPELPLIVASAQIKNPLLTYVMIHELSHIFDMANNIQQTWGPQFWQTQTQPLEQYDIPSRTRFCYYQCVDQSIHPNEAAGVYKEIENSVFTNSYAMMSNMEDFAEVSALYYWKKYPGAVYEIHPNAMTKYDVLAKLSAPVMQWKINYIEKFYSDPKSKTSIHK